MESAEQLSRSVVEAALALAVRAPSIHNTQPWAWRLDGGSLLLRADRTRQLAVADPDGHSLLISCGAALCLTELGLAGQGWQTATTLWPDSDDPDVLARIAAVAPQEPTDEVRARVAAAARRRSDRRPFADTEVTSVEREALRTASSNDAVWFDFPERDDQLIDLAVAVSWADRVERNDAAYVAEMQRWVRDPDVHATNDGVPLAAVPHVPADSPRHADIPPRDFEVGVNGGQLIERDVDEHPLIAVGLTAGDGPEQHLRAGMAMMQLMIEAERIGLSTCPLSQAVDLPSFRMRVQGLMGWVGFPQIMLRVGHPGRSSDELPVAPRRPVSAVLD